MIWWQNTINMHLSCKWTWWAFSSMSSTYVLLQADSACKDVRKLVHDVVLQKRYVLQGTYLFRMICHFKMVCPSSVFGRSGHRPSSSGHVPHGTRSCTCAYFVRTWIFTIVRVIAFSNRVRGHTNDLFGRSRVRTPGLAHDQFLFVQGSNPCLCSTIFLWVQGLIPWPWSPVLCLLYPWPTSTLVNKYTLLWKCVHDFICLQCRLFLH